MRRDVLDSGESVGHEVVPVGHCHLGISQSEEDVSELDLFRIVASLRLGPGQQLVGRSGRQLSPGRRAQNESQWCRGEDP